MITYLIKLRFKCRLQYGRALIYDIISGFLIYILDVVPLAVVLYNFKISNWSTAEILFLFSFSRAGRVFGDLMFWMPMFGIDSVLREGRLERYLLAPVNSFSYYICNQFTTFTLGHCMGSIVVAIICIGFIDIKFQLVNVVCFFIAFIGGALAYAGIIIVLGSIAFWTLDLAGISQILMDITKFTYYPLTLFPRAIQIILTCILPLGLASYYPSSILLGKQENGIVTTILIGLSGIVIFWLAYRIWWYGIKHYQGTGS